MAPMPSMQPPVSTMAAARHGTWKLVDHWKSGVHDSEFRVLEPWCSTYGTLVYDVQSVVGTLIRVIALIFTSLM